MIHGIFIAKELNHVAYSSANILRTEVRLWLR